METPFATKRVSPAELDACRPPAPASATPRCRFLVAEAAWPAYAAIAIDDAPPSEAKGAKRSMKRITDALTAKRKERDRLVELYAAIAADEAAPEWSVAAACRSAETMLEYVRALRAAVVPQALERNTDSLDLYYTELENIAFPAQEKAIEQLQATAQRARQFNLVTPYSARCQRQLDALMRAQPR